MLGELIDVVLDVAEVCGPCSGGQPDVMTWPGGGGAGGGGGQPDSGPPRTERQRTERERTERERSEPNRPPRRDRDRDVPDHDRPGYAQRQQLDNAVDVAFDLTWELVTSPSGNLGKVTGPLATVAAGSEVMAEGISTVLEADRIREQRIRENTGGHFDGPDTGRPGRGDPAPSGRDEPVRKDARQPEPPPERSPHEERAQREADRVMENIRIRQQLEDAGNAGWDGWKDWR